LGENTMTFAARRGNLDVIKAIAEINVGLFKEVGLLGENTMTFAARRGNLDVIRVIAKIDPNLLKFRDRKDLDALSTSIKYNQADVTKFILENFDDVKIL